MLYIPEFWSHAVLNLAESVGIATEFSIKEPPPMQRNEERHGDDTAKAKRATTGSAVEGGVHSGRTNVGVADEL